MTQIVGTRIWGACGTRSASVIEKPPHSDLSRSDMLVEQCPNSPEKCQMHPIAQHRIRSSCSAITARMVSKLWLIESTAWGSSTIKSATGSLRQRICLQSKNAQSLYAKRCERSKSSLLPCRTIEGNRWRRRGLTVLRPLNLDSDMTGRMILTARKEYPLEISSWMYCFDLTKVKQRFSWANQPKFV